MYRGELEKEQLILLSKDSAEQNMGLKTVIKKINVIEDRSLVSLKDLGPPLVAFDFAEETEERFPYAH